MDLGVYCGERRIGEMERVTEGLYTRLSFEYNCHSECFPPCHSERRRREESKEILHFVQNDMKEGVFRVTWKYTVILREQSDRRI